MNYIDIYKLLAQIHNTIEDSILNYIKPNISIYQLCVFIEEEISKYMNPLIFESKGIAFPVGININHCAAHYSPLDVSEDILISIDDVVKIDFGLQINGYILDAAFTVCFKDDYRELLDTTRRACMEAAKMLYPNTRLSSISKKIESIASRHFGILKDLCGHQIMPYKIHNGKVIPNVVIRYNEICKEGEIYTIEPYLTTNRNSNKITYDTKNVSHYMFNYHEKEFSTFNKLLHLMPSISKYNTLAFNKRWIDENEKKYLETLVKKGVYKEYPPIYLEDTRAKIAQFETTVLITNTEPIILKKYDNIHKYIIKVKE